MEMTPKMLPFFTTNTVIPIKVIIRWVRHLPGLKNSALIIKEVIPL